MKILKFGGSSVGSAETIVKVVEIVRAAAASDRCAVVLSAMQGTTDDLILAGRLAERGDDGYLETLSIISDRHSRAIQKLFPNGDGHLISDFVETTLKELEHLCEGFRLIRELSLKTLDRIISFG